MLPASTVRFRTPLLLAALLVPSVADAQVGRLIDRARSAATQAASASPPASVPEPSTGVASESPAASGPAPAVNHLFLLRQTIRVQGAEVTSPWDAEVIFADRSGTWAFAFLDASGRVLAETPAYLSSENTHYPGPGTFLGLKQRSAARIPAEAGAYTFAVLRDGVVLGALPFTVEAQASGDPFAPAATVELEGPWRDTAVLAFEAGDAEADLRVHLWVRHDEVGGGDGDFEVVLMRGGTEISGDPFTSNATNPGFWTHRDVAFRDADGRWIQRDGLADGAYRVVVRAGRREVKAYPFRVEGGAVVPHPASAIDTEPRADFRTPRSTLHDLAWLEAE